MIKITPTAFPCERATVNAAGYDVRSSIDVTLHCGDITVVPTGLFIEMDSDTVALVCPRSGLAAKGVTVHNAPGIIDADYSGEVKVILHSVSITPHRILAGDRIAQLVFTKWMKADDVVEVQREGGFGSTGV